MARTHLVETWDVETGNNTSYPTGTLAALAGHDWWHKPETRACYDGSMLHVGTGAGTLKPWKPSAGKPEPQHWWSYARPIEDWGPGVELWVATSAKCKRGLTWRRSVVFGRSPDVTDEQWLNQPAPHEFRNREIQPPCVRARRFRAAVRVRSGRAGDLETTLPGDRLVVPMHTSVGRAIRLEPLSGRPLDTPGRMLFAAVRQGRTSVDPQTGERRVAKDKGPTGFTGELWQAGWVAEPASYGQRLHGVAALVAVTREIWAPIWIETAEVRDPVLDAREGDL